MCARDCGRLTALPQLQRPCCCCCCCCWCCCCSSPRLLPATSSATLDASGFVTAGVATAAAGLEAVTASLSTSSMSTSSTSETAAGPSAGAAAATTAGPETVTAETVTAEVAAAASIAASVACTCHPEMQSVHMTSSQQALHFNSLRMRLVLTLPELLAEAPQQAHLPCIRLHHGLVACRARLSVWPRMGSLSYSYSSKSALPSAYLWCRWTATSYLKISCWLAKTALRRCLTSSCRAFT